MAAAGTSQGSHLLEELRGVLHRLKTCPQPITDGHRHLVPFCETLETVLRNGLKREKSHITIVAV